MQAFSHHPAAAAALGGFGLASAMGIGRFAFTPMLPLMQHAYAMPLQQGSWLASANYVGYLLGALLCVALDLRPGTAARFGLAIVAFTTLAMGLTGSFAACARGSARHLGGRCRASLTCEVRPCRSETIQNAGLPA